MRVLVTLSMNNISLMHYLTLSSMIFAIGLLGVTINYKNLIRVLVSIELILLSANINFVAFSYYMIDLKGQIASIIILSVAAAEAAVGLAIVVVFFRNKESISTEYTTELRG